MNSLPQSLLGLSDTLRASHIDLLNSCLADLLDLHSQFRQAHWNVRGRSFHAQHKLFEELAGMVADSLDELAERVAALGGAAKGTIRQAAASTRLAELNEQGGDELGFIRALAVQCAACGKQVRSGVETTAAAGDAGSSDLLTGISRDLDKALWILESHLR